MSDRNREKYEEHFKTLHKEGFKGLWKIYADENFLIKPPIIISFLLAAIICLGIALFADNKQLLVLIDNIVNIGLGLEGGLIGLTLAGLTLIVTFGSDKLMKHLVRDNLLKAIEAERPPKHSVYQRSVAKFTFAVFVQILTLLVLFTVNILMKLKVSLPNVKVNEAINILTFFLCLFLLFYSLILVLQMTLNIFTISQINHGVLSKDEMLNLMNSHENKSKKNTKD